VPLHRHEPEDLAEGDGEERIVDAAAMRDEKRNQRPRKRAGERGRRDAEPQVRKQMELCKAEGVGADAEVRAVSEGRQPAVAEEHVEAQAKDDPYHDLDAEIRIEPDGADPGRQRAEHREEHEHRRRQHCNACSHSVPLEE
jgi:hypothetical protein